MSEQRILGPRWARIVATGASVGLAALVVCSVPGLEPQLEANALLPAATFRDSDSDGLSDAFEHYLATASSDPALDANPKDPDSDGDGVPDGFEYCLSGGKGVVTPGVKDPTVATVTIGARQESGEVVLTVYMIPAQAEMIDKFRFVIGAPVPTGPVLYDVTDMFAFSVEAASSASFGPYSMGVYQTRIPMSLIKNMGSIAVGALATVSGNKVGDSATFTVHDGVTYRWRYEEDPSGANLVLGQAEPLTDADPLQYVPNQVCGSVDVQEPTELPGVLQSVVTSIGCNGGTWSCNGGVCSDSGEAAQPKLVLDVMVLLD